VSGQYFRLAQHLWSGSARRCRYDDSDARAIVPGAAIAAVALLMIAYLVATGSLAAMAFIQPNRHPPLGQRIREDVADLTMGE
jgi:hypothetical protein